jgi:hypothetical protein
MNQYVAVAAVSAAACKDFLAEGSVPITTSHVGETAFTSAAKPKSVATVLTSVMRLGVNIVERARVRVGVGERLCAGAMAAQKRPCKPDTKPVYTAARAVYRYYYYNSRKRAEYGS